MRAKPRHEEVAQLHFTHIHTYARTHIHRHAHTHTHTHTHTRTHTHTHTPNAWRRGSEGQAMSWRDDPISHPTPHCDIPSQTHLLSSIFVFGIKNIKKVHDQHSIGALFYCVFLGKKKYFKRMVQWGASSTSSWLPLQTRLLSSIFCFWRQKWLQK